MSRFVSGMLNDVGVVMKCAVFNILQSAILVVLRVIKIWHKVGTDRKLDVSPG